MRREAQLTLIADHVSLARSPSEAFTSPNESRLSLSEDSGYEPETNLLGGDSHTAWPGSQQPDCHGDRPPDAQNDQTPERQELSYAIDTFNQEFVDIDSLGDNLSSEAKLQKVGDGGSAPTTTANEQPGDLLSRVSSERRTFEKGGNGITCEGGKSEWEEPEDHAEAYRKRALDLNDDGRPEDDSTNLDNGKSRAWMRELQDHIAEINSAYIEIDGLYEGDTQLLRGLPSDDFGFETATPNTHHMACDGSNLLDPTPLYSAFGNQDQHNCVGSSSTSPQHPKVLRRRRPLPVDFVIHRPVYEDLWVYWGYEEEEQCRLTRKTLRALDRSLEEERRHDIKRFRENFMHQHRLLVDAIREHPIWLNPLANQLRSHRDAWDSAVSTMRRLSRLEAPLSLEDALCFLCASRAVVESSSLDDKLAYMSSFVQDLETWRLMFPQVEHFARIMWDLTMDHVPPMFCLTDDPLWRHTILSLRELAAVLVARTRFLFGLEGYGSVTAPGKLLVSSLLS